jgi:hypothetical protein
LRTNDHGASATRVGDKASERTALIRSCVIVRCPRRDSARVPSFDAQTHSHTQKAHARIALRLLRRVAASRACRERNVSTSSSAAARCRSRKLRSARTKSDSHTRKQNRDATRRQNTQNEERLRRALSLCGGLVRETS